MAASRVRFRSSNGTLMVRLGTPEVPNTNARLDGELMILSSCGSVVFHMYKFVYDESTTGRFWAIAAQRAMYM